MTTWNNTQKSSAGGVDFVFSDGSDFLFSDGLDFLFRTGGTEIVWNNLAKNSSSWSNSVKNSASWANTNKS